MARVDDPKPAQPSEPPPALPEAAGFTDSKRGQTYDEAQRFRILCESAPLGIFECDRSGEITFHNRQLLEILGIAHQEPMHEAWLRIVHPEDLSELSRRWQRSLRDGAAWKYDYRVKRPNRGLRWLRLLMTPICSASGEPTSFVGTVEDITSHKVAEHALLNAHHELEIISARRSNELSLARELLHHETAGRKRSEESVRASDERFQQLAESIDDIFWIGSLDMSQLLYISPACNRVWGRPEEHFYRNPMAFLDDVHPSDRRRVAESLPSMTEGTYDGVFRIVRPDGETRTLRLRAFPVRNAQGNVYRLAGLSQDITEAKQVEDELKAERRFLEHLLHVQEVERKLTAYDIHDGFVQSVIGAMMHLEAAAAEPRPIVDLPERLQLPLKLLREAVDEARRMISGLRPPIIDEQGLVAAIEYLINESAGQPTEVRFSHPVNFTRLEPVLEATLFRIVQEALSNVFRHSQSKTAEVRLTQTADRLRLEVEDFGIGFNAQRARGRSFGLRGIRERARLFGGTAVVHSSPGEGTRITVDVPLTLPFSQPPTS